MPEPPTVRPMTEAERQLGLKCEKEFFVREGCHRFPKFMLEELDPAGRIELTPLCGVHARRYQEPKPGKSKGQ